MIANIAPEYHFVPPGRFLDEPNWGGAVIMIPWNLYQVYGDTKVMTANYSTMVKWLNWEATTKAANGGNIVGLGDWSAAQSTTAQAIIDYGYYRGANTMAKIAQVLGNTADAATYSALATSLATEYNAKYLNTDALGHAWYANNTEASNAAALDAGLVPPQYHQAVVEQPCGSGGGLRLPHRHRLGGPRTAVPRAARRRPRRRDLPDGREPGLAGLRVPRQRRLHNAR